MASKRKNCVRAENRRIVREAGRKVETLHFLAEKEEADRNVEALHFLAEEEEADRNVEALHLPVRSTP